MNVELISTAIACGCLGLLAAAALKRRTPGALLAIDRLAVGTTKRKPRTGSRAPERRPGRPDAAGTARAALDAGATTVGGDPSDGDPWFDVDLFPAAGAAPGARFDDTVALPIDAAQRLDAAIHAVSVRLDALPDARDLSHRTIAYRARLKQIAREAARARRRLDEGTYGQCLTCEAPISLALLVERPWRRVCIRCALDI